MKSLSSLLNRPIVREPLWVAKGGEILCYIAAMFVMVIAFRRVAAVATTEKDVLFGMLLGSILGLLLVIMGLLVQINARLHSSRDRPAGRLTLRVPMAH